MAWLDWDEALSLGVPWVDDEHRRLIGIVNRVQETLDSGGDLTRAAALLSEFMKSLDGHFERETLFLNSLGHDGAERRRADHLRSRALLGDHPLDADDVELLRQAAEFARAWCIDHIVRQDLPLRDFYRAKGMAAGGPRRCRLPRIDFLKLRWRIALLAAVPLAAIVVLAGLTIADLRRDSREMALLGEMNALNAVSAGVIHELQRERGLSAMYVSAPGQDYDRLTVQIERTDRALVAFERAAEALEGKLPEQARDALDDARSALLLVPDVRGDVSVLSFDTHETIRYYTNAIVELVAVVPEVVRATLSSDFAKNTFAHVFLLEAKERAGRERALGASGLAAGDPAAVEQEIKRLAAEQSALEEGFLAVATPELAASYTESLTGSRGFAWEGMRRMLFEGGGNLTGADWFDAASERIDRMREVEIEVAERLAEDAATLQQRADDRSLVLGGTMAGLLAASVAMAFLLGWSILPPLRRLARSLRSLAEGDRVAEVPWLSARDELGDVARTVQYLKERLVQADLLEARRWTENAERLRAVADNVPGIVFRVLQPTAGRPVLTCVSRKLRDYGLAPAGTLGAPLRMVLRRLLRPEDRPAILHALRRAADARQPVTLEFRLRGGGDGESARWLRVVASPSRTADGWAWDGVALDVSGLKRAEQERAEATSRLNRFYRLQATSQLAGSIGQEIDDMLQPILGHAEMAALNLPVNSKAHQHVMNVLQAAGEARHLVNRVLCIGRHPGQHREPVDAVAVIASSIEITRPLLPRHIQVKTRLDGAGALVMVDAAEIHQVVTHLCANAAQAMGDEGGTLTIATGLTTPTAEDEPCQVKLTIRDTGCGMDQQVLSRVFSSLFAVSEIGKAGGLGLHLVRSIVEAGGGQIEVSSQAGQGTSFDVFLPIHEPTSGKVIDFTEAAKWRTTTA